MKNTNTQNKWMNRLQKSIGSAVLATALCACGTGADLASHPGILTEADRVTQLNEAMPMPDFEFITETQEEVELDTPEREAPMKMESLDEKRIFFFEFIHLT